MASCLPSSIRNNAAAHRLRWPTVRYTTKGHVFVKDKGTRSEGAGEMPDAPVLVAWGHTQRTDRSEPSE